MFSNNSFLKSLECIDYPGVVKNEVKALETLGGINSISMALSDDGRRLELRMRPKDFYCKPALSSREPVTAVLLKIKVKKKTREVVSYDVLGHITSEFRFTTWFDFQYLPVKAERLIYNEITPQNMDIQWFFKDMPLFLPPASFSRSESSQNYYFSKTALEKESDSDVHQILNKPLRKAIGFAFNMADVPTECPLEYNITGSQQQLLKKLQKLFEERPIYSRAALLNLTQKSHFQVKDRVSLVAYYFKGGPWRTQWVRYGYDPRKDPSAKIYQTLDFRVRSERNKCQVQRKRGSAMKGAKALRERIQYSHIFKPGMIPPARQFMLQYCDIHVPEIQSMLENLPPVSKDAKCHEVHGWLPPSFADTCRDIIHRYVNEEIERRKELVGTSVPLNVETYFSGSESDSEEEC